MRADDARTSPTLTTLQMECKMADVVLTAEMVERKQVKIVRDPARPGAPPEPREFGTPIRVLQATIAGTAPDCIILNGVPYLPSMGK